MRKGRCGSGSITLNADVDVDIYIRDIIDNLDDFGNAELEDLRDAIDRQIGGDAASMVFGASNLEEEQKIKILKEMFHKYTWQQLEDIKNKL